MPSQLTGTITCDVSSAPCVGNLGVQSYRRNSVIGNRHRWPGADYPAGPAAWSAGQSFPLRIPEYLYANDLNQQLSAAVSFLATPPMFKGAQCGNSRAVSAVVADRQLRCLPVVILAVIIGVNGGQVFPMIRGNYRRRFHMRRRTVRVTPRMLGSLPSCLRRPYGPRLGKQVKFCHAVFLQCHRAASGLPLLVAACVARHWYFPRLPAGTFVIGRVAKCWHQAAAWLTMISSRLAFSRAAHAARE